MDDDPAGFPGRRTLHFITAFPAAVAGHVPEHHHRGFEIVLHRGCTGVTTLRDGRSQAFADGSVVIYPPFQHHAQDTATPGDDLCVQVADDRPLPATLDRLLYLPPPLDGWCAGEIASLMQAPAGPTPGQQALLDHRATAVLAHLLQRRDATASGPLPPALRLVEQAKELLRAEYRNACRLDDIARRLGVSADHLRHRFTATAGTSPLAYLTGVRLERAKNLLANTNLPLTAIASACGFATARYLCSVFRRHVGSTPAVFRRRC